MTDKDDDRGYPTKQILPEDERDDTIGTRILRVWVDLIPLLLAFMAGLFAMGVVLTLALRYTAIVPGGLTHHALFWGGLLVLWLLLLRFPDYDT